MALSCTSLMAEAQTEYPGLTLDTRSGATVQLRNILMLPQEGLDAAQVVLKSFAADKAKKDAEAIGDVVPKMRDLLLLVADDTDAMAEEMTDWPVGMFVRIVDAWQEATQAGEAEGSDS